jgi:hypothetical protein
MFFFVPQLARWTCDVLVITGKPDWWGRPSLPVLLYAPLVLVWTVALGVVALQETQRLPFGKELATTLVSVAVTISFAGAFLR